MPSTRFYLEDKYGGQAWVTRLPFPVYVVERLVTSDRITGSRFVTRYAYHHGHFDGIEREFRGFGMVEQWDTEALRALSPDGQAESEVGTGDSKVRQIADASRSAIVGWMGKIETAQVWAAF